MLAVRPAILKRGVFRKFFCYIQFISMSISHTNKHIILQSHKHIAPTRSFNRDLHCFLLILKLRHILFNVQIYYMYSLYPSFFLCSFLIFTVFSLLVFIYICVHLFCPFLGNVPYYEILLFL